MENFEVSAMQMVHMEQANAEEFYEVYKGVVQEYPEMVKELTSGPCIAMEIKPKGGPPAGQDDNTAKSFREFAGPADPVCTSKWLNVWVSFQKVWRWASCQIHKIAGCACAGNAGNVFPATAG